MKFLGCATKCVDQDKDGDLEVKIILCWNCFSTL